MKFQLNTWFEWLNLAVLVASVIVIALTIGKVFYSDWKWDHRLKRLSKPDQHRAARMALDYYMKHGYGFHEALRRSIVDIEQNPA